MLCRPSLRLLDESARITRGNSVAVDETAAAHGPGRLVSRFWYEVRVVFAIGGPKGLFFESRDARNPRRIKF
jgi:hypothetical protein